jgi:hypothetical protein
MDICIFYKHHFSEYETRKKLFIEDEKAIENWNQNQKSPVLKVWERFRQMSLKFYWRNYSAWPSYDG